MGPGWDRTPDPWICSQTRICCQTCYWLRYAARYWVLYNGQKHSLLHFACWVILHTMLLFADKLWWYFFIFCTMFNLLPAALLNIFSHQFMNCLVGHFVVRRLKYSFHQSFSHMVVLGVLSLTILSSVTDNCLIWISIKREQPDLWLIALKAWQNSAKNLWQNCKVKIICQILHTKNDRQVFVTT